jgi:hypothetical protein
MFLNQSLVMAIIYLWSQYFKDAIVNFMFGIRFKGIYLPYVLLVLEILQIGIPWASIVGLLTGHLYYYLQDIYPESSGTRLLNTPQWLYQIFPPSANNDGGVRIAFGTILNPGRNAQQSESTGRNWGRGNRLGS